MHDRIKKKTHEPTQRPGDLIVSRNCYGRRMISIAIMIPYKEDMIGPTVLNQTGSVYQDWPVVHSDRFIAGN